MVVWAMWNSPFSASVFGMENMSLPRLLVIIFIVSSLLGLFISPLESWLSRKYEFEADEYAALYTHASSFREALSSLATNDLAWIPPSPLYSTWFSSHPSIPERILSLSGYEKNEVYTEKKKEE
jgi:STE24 endopeptidase